MTHTSDRNDPRLTRGVNDKPVEQAPVYLVLSDEDRAAGYVRPIRAHYAHTTCGAVTTMSNPLAETYAVEPGFYGATYCVQCKMHRPVHEFRWVEKGRVTPLVVGE